MAVQKGYVDKLNLLKWGYRIGKERRLNWTKHVLEEGTPMPEPITYKDIDEAFIGFVKNVLSISYDGREIPTMQLFSNQRLSEYTQAWEYQDANGNLQMNLKTISRELNPKIGELYDKKFNIPAPRTYAVYYIPTTGENGQVTYDRWSIRQPMNVNLMYTLQIVTNKLELINQFNTLVNHTFSGRYAPLFPKGHTMPMNLEDITDASENSIDNRKYYLQTYKIKVLGYVIDEKDITVEKLPSRWKPSVDVLGTKTTKKDEDSEVTVDYSDKCEEIIDDEQYAYRNVTFIIKTGLCNKPVEFTYSNDSDKPSEFVLQSLDTDNISDIRIFVNDEKMSLISETPVKFLPDDTIRIEYSRSDIMLNGEIVLSGYDSLTIIDQKAEEEYETTLDQKPEEADRIIEIE